MTLKVWYFDSTGEAYDACQCDEAIKNGDTLLIASEKVVGIADTWPVAVTAVYGKLHTPFKEMTLSECMQGRCDPAAVDTAKALATSLGWEIRN